MGGLFGATVFILFVSTLGFCAYVCTPSDKASSNNNQPSTSYSPPTPTPTPKRKLGFILEPPPQSDDCKKDREKAEARQLLAEQFFKSRCGQWPALEDTTAHISFAKCFNGRLDKTRPFVNVEIKVSDRNAFYNVWFNKDGTLDKIAPSSEFAADVCGLDYNTIIP